MFELIKNVSDWLYDLGVTLITFLKSVINGLSMMVKAFPKVITLATQSIGYVPSIFAVFITLTIIIYIVYLIIGRSAGGEE